MDLYNDVLKPIGGLGKKVAIKGGKLALKGTRYGVEALKKEAQIRTGRYEPVVLEYVTPATAPLGYTPKGTRVFNKPYNKKMSLAEQDFENDVKAIAARAGADHVVIEGYVAEDESSALSKMLNKGLTDQFHSFTAGEFKNVKIGSDKSTKISANLYLYKRP